MIDLPQASEIYHCSFPTYRLLVVYPRIVSQVLFRGDHHLDSRHPPGKRESFRSLTNVLEIVHLASGVFLLPGKDVRIMIMHMRRLTLLFFPTDRDPLNAGWSQIPRFIFLSIYFILTWVYRGSIYGPFKLSLSSSPILKNCGF